jgi:hypothetical protein
VPAVAVAAVAVAAVAAAVASNPIGTAIERAATPVAVFHSKDRKEEGLAMEIVRAARVLYLGRPRRASIIPCSRASYTPPLARNAREQRMLIRSRPGQGREVNDSYLSRILRLTLLAPEIIEAIATGRQPSTLQLDDLLKPLPAVGTQRSELFGSP